MPDDKEKEVETQPKPDATPRTMQDAISQFSALTTVPEAFAAGPVTGIAAPVTIEVKPFDGSRFVMIDDDPDRTREMVIYTDPYKLSGRTGNRYAVRGDLATRLLQEHPDSRKVLQPHQLYVGTYRHSHTLVLYPAKLPGDHPLSVDAYEEKKVWIKKCMEDWFRVCWNDVGKVYETTPTEIPNQPKADFNELYRGMTMDELIYKGFRDHFIADWDHAVLRAFRGV